MSLPRLSAQQPIVVAGGKPSSLFLQFMEKTREAQQLTDASQDATLAALQVIVDNLQAATAQTQIAQTAANDAQTTADEALGAGGTAGSATDPTVDITVGAGWITGPQVDLTGVVAGDLKITGSGPLQDSDVNLVAFGAASATYAWRIVEIDGMTETTVFTGAFTANQITSPSVASVVNASSSAAASFVLARTNTGAISYRIDVESSTLTLQSLSLYVYARRMP